MPPLPFHPISLLHGFVLRLAVMLGGSLVVWCLVREGWMRARVAGMPVGRRRARSERALAVMVRVREALAAPGFLDDARTLGKAAEVARCVGDAGRRSPERRFGLLFSRGRGMRAIARGAVPAEGVMAGRCRCGHGVACGTAMA